MQEITHSVAIFIDYANVSGHIGNGTLLKPQEVIRRIENYARMVGKVGLVNTYMPVGSLKDHLGDKYISQNAYHIYTSGAQAIHAPSFDRSMPSVEGHGTAVDSQCSEKNISDEEMMCDIVETIFTRSWIDTFFIATGDKDFLPAIRKLRNHGKNIILFRRSMQVLHASLVYEIELGKVDLESGDQGDGVVRSRIVVIDDLPPAHS